FRHDEIAVLFRNLAPAQRRVREIFGAHQIPVFLDVREEQLHTAPARVARLVLALHSRRAGVEPALALFRSAVVPGAREEADRLEMMARRAGIERAAELLEAAPALLGEGSMLASLATSLSAVLRPDGARPARMWVHAIRSAFAALRIPETLRRN